MIEPVLWGDYQQQSSTPPAIVLIDLASNWLRCLYQLERKAAPWPSGCTLVWSDSEEQRKFQRFPSSAFVSLSRHTYEELTPEVSNGLFLSALLSSSKAIKGCRINRDAEMVHLITERTREVRDCILKSLKERKKERKKEKERKKIQKH